MNKNSFNIKEENIFLNVFFNFITFGIYGFFLMYKYNNIFSKKIKMPKSSNIENIFSILVICFFLIFYVFLYQEKLIKFKIILFSLFILLVFIFIIWWIIYCIRFSVGFFKISKNIWLTIIFGLFSSSFLFLIFGIIVLMIYFNKNIDKFKIEKVPSKNENNCKNYINTYKKQYSKDDLKKVLSRTGIEEEEINLYLKKYY